MEFVLLKGTKARSPRLVRPRRSPRLAAAAARRQGLARGTTAAARLPAAVAQDAHGTPTRQELGGGSGAGAAVQGQGAGAAGHAAAIQLLPAVPVPARARVRSLSPPKSPRTLSLARVEWTPATVKTLIYRTERGSWPASLTNKQQRYRLKKWYDQYDWAVKNLRRNRWTARVVRRQDLQGAADADDEAEQEEDGGGGDDDDASISSGSSSGSTTTASSSSSDSHASSSNSDDSASESDSGSDGSSSSSSHTDSSDESVPPIGRAADGSSDSVREKALFVRSVTRSPGDVDRQGQRLSQQQWFEVVPRPRVKKLLQSLWHAAGGEQMVSASRLYSRVAETYVGVSLADVKAFVLGQEAVQLGRSNAVSDAIVAPSLPTKVNDQWGSDITYLDSTIASSGGYVGFVTVVDALSKWAWTTPVRDKAASTVAQALDQLMTVNGAPKLLVLDSARENKSNAVKLVAARHGVTVRWTKPHASQENGMVERAHQTLKALLRRLQLDLAKAGRSLPLPDLLGRYRHIQLQRTQRHAYGALGSLLRPSATEDTAAFAAGRSA